MNDIENLVLKQEQLIQKQFEDADKLNYYWSKKVLESFKNNNVSESDFASSTGYGYNDIGRDKIERIYADIFNGEDALVRCQLISGTHAITTSLFGLLRPNDIMLSISGLPYDTLHEVIGIKSNPSSLESFNIKYKQIDLINDDFDYDSIKDVLKNNTIKLIHIQRSKGYSTRKSIEIEKIEKVIKEIRKVDKEVIILIDNCYTEFVEYKSPLEVGADIIIGSLIKNLGGTICSNGGYIVGKKDLIHLISERLNVPGEAKEVGPSLNMNRELMMGLFHAPSAVCAALKTAILTSKVLEEIGYEVEPKYTDKRVDIVQNIIFNNREDLINYCKGIQSASPIDSNALPQPTKMPGYDDEIIMASGSFTQGSSIEISCDGPLRKPFIAYQQGATTYEYGKIALINAINYLNK